MSGTDIPVDPHGSEGDDEEHGHVPPYLLELHEVLEWEKAVEDEGS